MANFPSTHKRRWQRGLAGVVLATLAAAASAHDTWFEPMPTASGELRLALGTGDRFPAQQFAVGPEYLARQGCSSADGSVRPMSPQGVTPTALLLSVAVPPGAMACWAQLMPFEIELPADAVRVYFKEINPPADVRETWAAMQARGLPWRERYTKHARIEIAGAATIAARPSGMGMDIVMQAAPAPLRPGDEFVVQVLRDGKPLPGFAVELRSELSPLGVWRQTDADGRVRVQPPLPGRWVLRGTELRPPETDAGFWESRFVTLAFEVAPTKLRVAEVPGPRLALKN